MGVDLGRDLVVVVRLLGRKRRPRGRLLRGREGEDGAPVLIADVRPLLVRRRRIVRVPEDAQELRVGHLLRVEFDQDGLGVTGL